MKLCVVAPSHDTLAQAGVRIRYRRIAPYFAARGDALEICILDDLGEAGRFDCDAYLFSKCYDARAQLLARVMRGAGKRVGIDLFDDIFSQTDDSRFVRHRAWLRDMATTIDFVLASTERMREIVRGYAPDVPAHVLNDPFEAFDVNRIGARIAEKAGAALAERTIRVVWFGIGDNPHFPVGLSDLSCFGHDLNRLGTRGFKVRLEILTNRRALATDGLRMIARLGVPHRVSEWTREREADVLDESLVAFLPVSGQAFSIAKSLNRAVTALTGGAQVLSAGYPLYEALSPFLYRYPAKLLEDIERDKLRLRSGTLAALAETLGGLGDPAQEVARLLAFLTKLPPPVALRSPRLAVIHGRKSPAEVGRQARRLDQLSVATPFSPANGDHDVRIAPRAEPDRIEVRLSKRAVERLAPQRAANLEDRTKGGFRTITLAAPAAMIGRLAAPRPETLGGASIAYEAMLRDVDAIVHYLISETRTILSENEGPLTVDLGNGAPGDPSRRLKSVGRAGG